MTTLTIVNPGSLLGKELKAELERRPELWSTLNLVSTSDDEAGVLTEAAGEAALVQPLDETSLGADDVIFVCGDNGEAEAALARLPETATRILLARSAAPADGLPLVSGVNMQHAERGRLLVSPHPGAVALSQLLHPLRDLGLVRATAWIQQPASMFGQRGLDELFNQTRSIAAFQGAETGEVFPHQLAFNVLPSAVDASALAAETSALVGDVPISLQLAQAALFHGLTLSVHAQFAPETEVGQVEAALDSAPFVERFERPDVLGPIEVAGRQTLLAGSVETDSQHPGAFWLWAVADNLTLGGATNAVAIAEALVASTH